MRAYGSGQGGGRNLLKPSALPWPLWEILQHWAAVGAGAEVPLEALWALLATVESLSSVRLVAAPCEPVCIHECCGKCWCTGQVLGGALELPYMPLNTGKMLLPWAGVVGAL